MISPQGRRGKGIGFADRPVVRAASCASPAPGQAGDPCSGLLNEVREAFRDERLSPGGCDPHLADIDQPGAGADLLAREVSKSMVDQANDHTDTKSVCHEQRLRCPIEAHSREHSQRTALFGSEAHPYFPARRPTFPSSLMQLVTLGGSAFHAATV